MDNKKLNLCEILKDCPKGTKLYSTVFGEVQFDGISKDKEDKSFPIMVSKPDNEAFFTIRPNGCLTTFEDAECCLFPSKENRDWSTFKSKKECFDPKTLKPFDNVLARDYDGDIWRIDIFSDINHGARKDSMRCIGRNWYQCVPYNDDTKHLIGTTNDAPEYYRYWE